MRRQRAAVVLEEGHAEAGRRPAGPVTANRPTRKAETAFGARMTRARPGRIMSNNNNRPMYYSQIRIDPKNDNIVTSARPLHKSTDGGKTFHLEWYRASRNSDHHAIWINPDNANHLMLGNDGGSNVSYDQGRDLGVRQHDRDGAVLLGRG